MVWVNLGAMESKKALKVREIIRLLEDWAPPVLQESYDNTGLIVGDRDAVVNQALVCLDCTEEVVKEAEAEGAEGEAPAEGAEAAAKDGDAAKKDDKTKEGGDKKPEEKKPAEKK